MKDCVNSIQSIESIEARANEEGLNGGDEAMDSRVSNPQENFVERFQKSWAQALTQSSSRSLNA